MQYLGPKAYQDLPIGSIVVPFWGSYLESYNYMVIPKRNYYGAYGIGLGFRVPSSQGKPSL